MTRARAGVVVWAASLAAGLAAACLAPRPAPEQSDSGPDGGGDAMDAGSASDQTVSNGATDGPREAGEGSALEDRANGGLEGGLEGGPIDTSASDAKSAMDAAGSGPADGGDAEPIDAAIDAPPYVDPGIFCGNTYCNPQSFVCCVDVNVTGMGSCFLPANAGTNCGSYFNAPLACDDTLDCESAGHAGSICCGILLNGVELNSSSCTAVDTCRDAAAQGIMWPAVVCDPHAPLPCPGGAPCVPVDGGLWVTGIGPASGQFLLATCRF